MSLIYAIPMMIPSQKFGLDTHCFGDCGKISMAGAMVFDDVGPCWICCEENCPYEKGNTGPIGTSEMTGDEVAIRGLLHEGEIKK